MAGVRDTDVIDVVAHDPSANEYMLVMVEDRRWGKDPAQAAQLREKINTYAEFILNGDLARAYPETTDEAVRIQLDCTAEPPGEFAVVLDHESTKLDERGIRLVVNVQS